MPPGRPPLRVCGLTAAQWATALGEPTATSLRRARAVLSGGIEPGPHELARVSDSTGVDLGELVRALASLRGYVAPEPAVHVGPSDHATDALPYYRALASLRGYLAPDAPAGDPDGPALVDGD